jgi:hypothetical protein
VLVEVGEFEPINASPDYLAICGVLGGKLFDVGRGCLPVPFRAKKTPWTAVLASGASTKRSTLNTTDCRRYYCRIPRTLGISRRCVGEERMASPLVVGISQQSAAKGGHITMFWTRHGAVIINTGVIST